VVRAGSDPTRLAAAIRGEVQAIDGDQPVANIQTLSGLVSASVSRPRYRLEMLGSFVMLALILAAVGVYGVEAGAAVELSGELGIRMALGAGRGDVVRLIVKQGMAPALLGVGSGLLGAWVLTRLLSSLLHGVSATDPVVFAGNALLLTGVALAACYVPARRASRVDPMSALRYERDDVPLEGRSLRGAIARRRPRLHVDRRDHARSGNRRQCRDLQRRGRGLPAPTPLSGPRPADADPRDERGPWHPDDGDVPSRLPGVEA